MDWDKIAVVVSVIGAAVLIVRDLYKTFYVDRRQDKQNLESAKAQQPEIMKQLEAGNFKAAAEGIAIAQTFVKDQLTYAQAEIERLRARETALEAEAAGWEKRDEEREARIDELERRVTRAEARAELLQEQLTKCQRYINRK